MTEMPFIKLVINGLIECTTVRRLVSKHRAKATATVVGGAYEYAQYVGDAAPECDSSRRYELMGAAFLTEGSKLTLQRGPPLECVSFGPSPIQAMQKGCVVLRSNERWHSADAFMI